MTSQKSQQRQRTNYHARKQNARHRLHAWPDAEHRPSRRWHGENPTGGLDSSTAWRCRPDPSSEGRWRSLGRGREEGPAAAATIERIRAELEVERSTEGYSKRKEADARRREKAQAVYVEDFYGAVLAFLGFHDNYADLAARLVRAVTNHSTPVGAGTVARTQRIPIEQRAEAAVIAWLRHQTTGYDGMTIPKVKGKRREVRRMPAQRSKELLGRYRRGEPAQEGCPLKRALSILQTSQ